MKTHTSVLRLVALSLLVVIAMTVAAPARAEADILLVAGIATVAVAVVLLVVYLVVANVHDSRRGEAAPTYVVCAETPGQPTSCELPAGAVAVGVVSAPVPQS